MIMIGIGNTNTYLKQRFGQSYGIEITSRIMESTKVIIKLPVQKWGKPMNHVIIIDDEVQSRNSYAIIFTMKHGMYQKIWHALSVIFYSYENGIILSKYAEDNNTTLMNFRKTVQQWIFYKRLQNKTGYFIRLHIRFNMIMYCKRILKPDLLNIHIIFQPG